MVERQMRSSIKMIGDFWYSAWVNAGQPDLKELLDFKPTAAELKQRKEELEKLNMDVINKRSHEH